MCRWISSRYFPSRRRLTSTLQYAPPPVAQLGQFAAQKENTMQERRSFERVAIPESAGVYVSSAEGERLGGIVMLGRGGFLLATGHHFEAGKKRDVVLVDEGESIRTPVKVLVRYTSNQGVGFEFTELTSDAA